MTVRFWISRAGVSATAVFLVAACVFGAPVSAAPGPAVAVSPSQGLTDGQVVTVSGTGFPTDGPGFPLPPTAFVQACSSDILTLAQPVSIDDAVSKCGAPQPNVDTSPNGTFTTTLAVQREFTSFSNATISCVAPGSCAMTAAFYSGIGFRFVGQLISFRVPTPASPADCKNGGYAKFGDTLGRVFRNQGQCVSWANHNARRQRALQFFDLSSPRFGRHA
jgi:hypothetical protein